MSFAAAKVGVQSYVGFCGKKFMFLDRGFLVGIFFHKSRNIYSKFSSEERGGLQIGLFRHNI